MILGGTIFLYKKKNNIFFFFVRLIKPEYLNKEKDIFID